MLVEVTEWFKELLFTENDRRTVLAVVEQVIPSLERRRDRMVTRVQEKIFVILSTTLWKGYGCPYSRPAADPLIGSVSPLSSLYADVSYDVQVISSNHHER